MLLISSYQSHDLDADHPWPTQADATLASDHHVHVFVLAAVLRVQEVGNLCSQGFPLDVSGLGFPRRLLQAAYALF